MTATLTLEARRDLRRRAEAATRGRWAAATPSDDTPETSGEWVRDALLAPDAPAAAALWCTWAPDDDEVPGPRIVAVAGDGPHAEADADWIAAANPAVVLALLDKLDAAEALLAGSDAPHPDRPDCVIVGGSGIRVTATDLETGESQSAVIDNNYALICAGNRYQSGIQYHANGTVTLTVKVRKRLAPVDARLDKEPQP